ncbi:MAG: DUF3857 and transglutaminase domain-containing protein [Deltaproteobacteria bacterium]|nr:DUF3857 and transglutaminase domain-containing protein [Deltaproteobacteria bacterium]
MTPTRQIPAPAGRATMLLAAVLTALLLAVPAARAGRPDFLRQVTRAQYPHDHAVLALEEETITYEADGRSRGVDEIYLTVLDDQGRRENTVQSFSVNLAYGRLEIPLMEIIKADGRRRQVDLAANSREDTSTRNTLMNIYNPNQKVIKVFLPDLEVGDTIHYRTVRERFKPVIPNQFYGLVVGQYLFPVREYRFTIKGPASMPMHHLVKDEVKGCVRYREKTTGGRTTRSWVFSRVPALTPEPSMPPYTQVAMRLLYSSLDSWEAISRWYFKLVEPKLRPSPAMEAKVRELVANRQSPAAKMAAIYYFVAQQVRYMGITTERNRPGFEPHEVSLTFSRRHGVCRDKAALLVSMLRLAGFSANPVLISVGDKLDPEIPLPYFNHAITVVNDDNGHPAWFMDPTSETSRQFFPDYERDSSYLIADRRGDTLRLTPPAPPESNCFRLQIEDEIDADGTLTGVIKATCTGFSDTVMRSILMRRSREEQGDFLRGMLRRRRPGIEIIDLQWADPADRSAPFTFSCRFTLRQTIRPLAKGKSCFFPLTNMLNPGVLDRWILGKADMTRRKFPLRLGYTYSTIITEQLRGLPALGRIRLPVTTAYDTDTITYYTACSLSPPDTLTIRRYFALNRLEVPAADYRQLTNLQFDREQETFLPFVIETATTGRPAE